MLNTEPLTLAHPAVQAAKHKFERGKWKRKIPFTFDELFEYFKADCIRFAAIAKAGGVKRQAIQQLYNRFFRELFEGMSGWGRIYACTLETRLVQVKRSEGELFREHPLVKKIAKKARLAGCTVEAVPARSHGQLTGKVITQTLLINGHVCSLHNPASKRQSRGKKRCYACTIISSSTLVSAEAILLHTTLRGFAERTFVVPTAVLRKAHPQRNKLVYVYLPTERLPVYKNQHPRIDYWQYEDGWHLLPPKQNPPAPR